MFHQDKDKAVPVLTHNDDNIADDDHPPVFRRLPSRDAESSCFLLLVVVFRIEVDHDQDDPVLLLLEYSPHFSNSDVGDGGRECLFLHCMWYYKLR